MGDIEKTILRLCEDLVRAVYVVVSQATNKGNKSIVAFVVLLQASNISQACGMYNGKRLGYSAVVIQATSKAFVVLLR